MIDQPCLPSIAALANPALGKGLVRPECVLATKAGDLYTADWRGGVPHLFPNGHQVLYAGPGPDGLTLKPNGIALQRDGSFLVTHLGATDGGVFQLKRSGQVTPWLRAVDQIDLPPTNFVLLEPDGAAWVTVSTRLQPRALGYRRSCSDGFIVRVDARGARVVALEKPSTQETGQWYFQRYTQHLPTYGEMVFFDRSWYNRTGVERVMGFCSAPDYLEFLREAPEFERMLVRSGIRLYKFWFSVSRDEQLRRFNSRRSDPLKHWKLSPIDIQSLDKWDAYTDAKEVMFFHTDTADSPWLVVKSDDKKRARLNCMRHFLSTLPYPGKDADVARPADPRIVGAAAEVLASSGQ